MFISTVSGTQWWLNKYLMNFQGLNISVRSGSLRRKLIHLWEILPNSSEILVHHKIKKKKKVFAASFPLIDEEKQREKSSLRLRAPTDFKPQKTPDPNSCLQESAME